MVSIMVIAGATKVSLYSPNCREKLSKSLGRAYNLALRATTMVLFGPFWRSFTGQNQRSERCSYPFRTVSEGLFSETGLSALRGFSEVSGELLWVALCFRWDWAARKESG